MNNSTNLNMKDVEIGKSNNIDLILILLITIFTVVSIFAPFLKDSFIRIILGILFVLFLPGYSLIAALFPKKDDLDSIERLALSFGLSIAITPLIGLILNYTPFGIRLEPIIISISAFTILMSIIALIRRSKLPDDQRFTVEFKKHYNNLLSSFRGESKVSKILSILLVLSILVAVSATIYAVISPKQGEKFTEFYILGSDGKASNYPTNLTRGQTENVTIGIVNHENAPVNYNLIIKLNNQTLKEENIVISDGQKYEQPFTFVASNSGENQKLEFLLYKLPDINNAYRSLHLWINVE